MAGGTDTLHVVVPLNADEKALSAACSQFGELAGIRRLEPPWAEVVFYDTRSAAKALESFSAGRCRAAEQSLTRTARLAGSVQLEAKDLPGVAGIDREDDDDSAFTVEFFDSRNAERYCKMMEPDKAQKSTLPPGLELPPGLDMPPGLGLLSEAPSGSDATISTAASSSGSAGIQSPPSPGPAEEVCKVRIRGLPNKMLSEAMVEGMLQQASLESALIGFTVARGEPCGEVLVRLSSAAAASRCERHFKGRRWDASGEVVTAEVLPADGGAIRKNNMPAAAAEHRKGDAIKVHIQAGGIASMKAKPAPLAPVKISPAAWLGSLHDEAWGTSTTTTTCRADLNMSATAPAFVPTSFLGASASRGLSAEAPAFVPGGGGYAAWEKATSTRPTLWGVNSDASTDIDETSENGKVL